MDEAVFVLEEGTNSWRYKDFVMREVEDYRWEMKFNNVTQVHESIYDAISYISNNYNLNPTFRLYESAYDFTSSCS